MHVILAVFFWLLSPTFFHDLIAQTPTRMIAISASVLIVVQILKVAFPLTISGRVTVLINFVASIAGVFAGLDPAHFWSQTTLSQILVVFTAASGVHTITKTLAGQTTNADPVLDTLNRPNLTRNAAGLVAILVMAGCLGVSGCGLRAATPATAPALPVGAADETDAHANDVLKTIEGFMKPIVRDIANGKLQATAGQKKAVNTLDGYYNRAVVAEKEYHYCMTVTAKVATLPPAAPAPNAATCLTEAGLTGALANAQSSFHTAQAALALLITPAKP